MLQLWKQYGSNFNFLIIERMGESKIARSVVLKVLKPTVIYKDFTINTK